MENTRTPSPFPLIEVTGTPFDRGVSYGRQAAGRIIESARHYTEQIDRIGPADTDWKALVHDIVPAMEAFDASYVEEMRGIAQGAGIPFEHIVLVNARTEIVKLIETRRGSRPAQDSGNEGCTSAVVLPAATRDEKLIHAQNWDWKLSCVDSSVVLLVRREDGPDVLTFTEAGGLARSGMNSAGVAITANYLECERDLSRVGVPLPLVRRKALECEHFALALRVIHATEKSSSNNMTLSHTAGLVYNFECAPDETFIVQDRDGLLVHANHWLSDVALTKIRDHGLMSMPDSLYRQTIVDRHLRGRIGTLTPEDVIEALRDDFAAPWSVCRPPRKNLAGVMTATVATVVMDPTEGLMRVAPLPTSGAPFAEYRLTPDRSASAQINSEASAAL